MIPANCDDGLSYALASIVFCNNAGTLSATFVPAFEKAPAVDFTTGVVN